MKQSMQDTHSNAWLNNMEYESNTNIVIMAGSQTRLLWMTSRRRTKQSPSAGSEHTTKTGLLMLDGTSRNTQVCRNYTTPHKTQMIDTTINLLVNWTEYTNLSGTTLTLRLAVKSDNSSPAILFRDSEKLDATIKLSLTLPTHSCRCPHGRTKSGFTHNNVSKFHKLRSL